MWILEIQMSNKNNKMNSKCSHMTLQPHSTKHVFIGLMGFSDKKLKEEPKKKRILKYGMAKWFEKTKHNPPKMDF